jgi:hypothetical protein
LCTPSLSRFEAITEFGIEKEQRLALLLADGTGDFDYVHCFALDESTVVLRGSVASYALKQKAESLAQYAGFTDVMDALRITPESRQ